MGPHPLPREADDVGGGSGAEPWKSVSRVQLYVSEHDYADGTRLVFDVGEVALLRLTAPAIAGMDAPRHVLLPRRHWPSLST